MNTRTFGFLIFCVLAGRAQAAPFDKTGIVDLRNEATIVGSCFSVGTRMIATVNRITNELYQSPSKGQDADWKRDQQARDLRGYADRARSLAGTLNTTLTRRVPPSQAGEFSGAAAEAAGRVDQATNGRDPWQVIEAWKYCESRLF